MTPLQVFNTLTGKKEEFVPLQGKLVRIYACGPTPYDLSHLGHARMAVLWDVVQRYLRHAGYDVIFGRNITDIDDKIIARAAELGWRPEQVAREYTYAFWQDMHHLNVSQPDFEPRATEFIHPMIDFVSQLVKKGHAYVSSGDVYFDISSFKNYGKLKKQDPEEMLLGARDQVRSQQELENLKRSPLDFALWKSADKGEFGWDSPWGWGRPGWHLECSTMIKHVLGVTIDIHGGGEDLIFPHHENEIAQSESLHDQPLARYWMHNSFVVMGAEKMSKSLGNFTTVQNLLQTYSPDTIRLFILQTHYRSPIEFNAESLNATRTGLQRLIRAANSLSEQEAGDLTTGLKAEDSDFTGQVLQQYQSQFAEAMNNDFNTAAAVAILFNLADMVFQEPDARRKLAYIYALQKLADVLGLTLEDFSQQIDSHTASGVVDILLSIRETARANKDFATSDLIRNELSRLGIKVMDSGKTGATWEYN